MTEKRSAFISAAHWNSPKNQLFWHTLFARHDGSPYFADVSSSMTGKMNRPHQRLIVGSQRQSAIRIQYSQAELTCAPLVGDIRMIFGTIMDGETIDFRRIISRIIIDVMTAFWVVLFLPN